MVWEKTLGVHDFNVPEFAYAVKATPDGGCVVAGEARLYDPLDEAGLTSSYKFEMYIAKLDSTGTTEWEKRYGGADFDRANSITTTTDGGYIVAGSTQSFAEGYTTPPPHNKKDAWIIKMDKNGDKQWEVVHGGPEGDGINSIIQTSDGGYAAAGFTASKGAGLYDCWVVKLDSRGTIVWEKTYGGKNVDKANCIIQTSDRGYAVAGETWSYGAGRTDFLCLKITADGTLEWLKTYGGSKFERARSIRQTPDGDILWPVIPALMELAIMISG